MFVHSGRQALLSPQEVFAMLLRHLVQHAAKYLGQPIDGAVITVPAEFNEVQRQAIRTAAQLAGLDNVQLLQGATCQSVFDVLLLRQAA